MAGEKGREHRVCKRHEGGQEYLLVRKSKGKRHSRQLTEG